MPGRRRPGSPRKPEHGQHFLASAQLAARLVHDAGIAPDDRVVEFGAGSGTLTDALARTGAHVLAIELDPELANVAARRFASTRNVTVLCADATSLPLPTTPYRVLANPAWNTTAATLHHLLDDPTGGLERADLVVQWQVARARAQPTDLLGAIWDPWWEFRRGRRIPAALFRPAPSVDAAVLIVTRRADPLLPVGEFVRHAAFLRGEFARGRATAGSRPLGGDGSAGRGP